MAGRADAERWAGPSGPEQAGDLPPSSTAPTVVERVVYRDGGDDGTVELGIGYEIPEAVSRLAFWIERPSVAVVATDGFERSGVEGYTWQGSVDGPAFEWDGSGDRAAVRLRQPLPDGEPATYGGGDGDWALCLRPRTHTRWRYRGREPRIDRQAAVRGLGVAGEQFALLGEHERFERTVCATAGQSAGGPADAGVDRGRSGSAGCFSPGRDAGEDQAVRSERSERGERSGRSGGTERSDRSERPDPSERSERLRLIVPHAADPAAAPGRILDALTAASERLAIGGRNRTVTAFVAPTAGVTWAHRGLSLGPDARVNDAATLSDPTNVWVHEYVHTRQDRSATTPATEWLLEATAEYYALALAFERGAVDFRAYRDVLERGIGGDAAGAVLADPATWTGDAQYRKGALVVAALDRRIRTSNGATFQAVLRAWNERTSEPFDADAFAAAVEAAGGPAARAAAVSYTQTSATPSCWDELSHAAAFDRFPADPDAGLRETVGAPSERAVGERAGDVAVDAAAARHR
jgi:hypothetical protein